MIIARRTYRGVPGRLLPPIQEPDRELRLGGRLWCSCGQGFWTDQGYRAHYGYIHVLEGIQA